MKKCKHEDVTFVETIEAYHTRVFNGLEYFNNNEYGNRVRIHVRCDNCLITRCITSENQFKQPKWVADRILKMRTENNWFLD